MSLATKLAFIPNISTNYIPRATATGFVNGMVYDDGTNVTIGGTTGGYKLNVLGTGNFTGALSGTSATFSSSVTVGGSSTLDSLKVGTSSTHQLLIEAQATRIAYLENK